MERFPNNLVLLLVLLAIPDASGIQCYVTVPGRELETKECPGSCLIMYLIGGGNLYSFAGCLQTVKEMDCQPGNHKLENVCFCNENLCNKPFVPPGSLRG